MRSLFFIFILVSSGVFAQSKTNISSLLPEKEYDNLSIHSLNSDSNVTSVVIWIRKEVKPHLHASHTEHVYILEGNGRMLLGEKTIDVNPGDLIFIPENTQHALKVTSDVPMKVISIQAPEFDGKDRVPVDIQW